MGVLFLIAGHLFQEFRCPRLRDRAQIINQLFSRHADAVVADRNGLLFLVDFDADFQIRIVALQRLIREGLEAQFVCGVRCI